MLTLVVALVLAHSYHVDWCDYHPQCAHTGDICKYTYGASMTRPLNELLIAHPDTCSRGYRMYLARACAMICSVIPLRGTIFGLFA